MAKFHENLKKYIANRGLRMNAYAKILGMKPSTMGNYCSGERLPDTSGLMKIFDADPNLSANFLLFGIGEMYLSKCGLSRSVDTYSLEDAMECQPEESVSTTIDVKGDDASLVAALQERIRSQQDTIKNLLEKLDQRDDMIKNLIGKVCEK